MNNLVYLLIALFIIIVSAQDLISQPKVIAYLPSWVNWELDNIEADKINEIKLGFYQIDKQGNLINGIDSPEATFDENIQQLKDLKALYRNLKVSFVVGGGTYNPRNFSQILNNPKTMNNLINSIIAKLEYTGFDGVGIDWEFPSKDIDKKNFNIFLKELKEALTELEHKHSKGYLLSYALPASSWIAKFIDLKYTVKYVDYIEVMTYDLVGSSSIKTGHNANLYKTDQDITSTSEAMETFYKLGVPYNKLAMGVPFYSIKFENVTKDGNGLYNSIIVKKPAIIKYISYSQLKNYYRDNPLFKKFSSPKANSLFLFNKKEGHFITYLEPPEISNIASYINKKDMYGAMIWHLWQDDQSRSLFKAVLSGLN